jgi:hypothetical protein
MPTYKAPVEDVQFLLNDVFHMERYGNTPGFPMRRPMSLRRSEEAAKFSRKCSRRSAASAISRLQAQCRRQCHDAEGLQEAYRQLVEGGWSEYRCRRVRRQGLPAP